MPIRGPEFTHILQKIELAPRETGCVGTQDMGRDPRVSFLGGGKIWDLVRSEYFQPSHSVKAI